LISSCVPTSARLKHVTYTHLRCTSYFSSLHAKIPENMNSPMILFFYQICFPPFPPLLVPVLVQLRRILTRFSCSHISFMPRYTRALLSLISFNFSLPALQRKHASKASPYHCVSRLISVWLRKNIRLEQNIHMYLLY